MSRNESQSQLIISFDDVFCEKRTSLRLSVTEVARSTRLPEKVIKIIESEDFSESGTDVYMRGYINIYAKFLNLDENGILEKFDEQKPVFSESVEQSVIAGFNEQHTEIRQHSLLFTAVTVTLVAGMFVIAYTMLFEGRMVDLLGLETDSSDEMVIPSVNEIDITNLNNATDSNTTDILTNNESTSTLPIYDLTASDLVNPEPIEGLSLESDDLTLNEGENSESEINSDNQLLVDDTEGLLSSNKSEPKLIKLDEDGKASISIKFSDECWISVKDSTGKEIISGLYRKGKSISGVGKLPFKVHVPRVNATKEVTIGGKIIQLSSMKKVKGRYLIEN